MSALELHPGLDLGSLPRDHRLRGLLRARLPEVPRPTAPLSEAPHAFWPAAMFGLDRVSVYRTVDPSTQARILERCGRGLLEEAYFIEKAGISFGAVMVLLGQSVEERMLYATFASEEARHFEGIRAFLQGHPPDAPSGPFLAHLSEVIALGDRTTLQLTIQIVLEGFGLSHYRGLRDHCQHMGLWHVLDGILRDEAGHHGSGRVLFDAAGLDRTALDRIEAAVAPLLRMIQAGPQSVLDGLATELGGLTRAQQVAVLHELEGPSRTQVKLDLLRQLLRIEGLEPLVGRLSSLGLFTSLPPEECV